MNSGQNQITMSINKYRKENKMDYKEKYEQALERCKKEFNFNNLAYSHEEIKQRLEHIFPELKESEDEKIRKQILDCFKTMKQQGCFPSKHKEQYNSWIAWLEKQKERGPLSKDEEYTLARIIEYLEDNDCPSAWKDLLYNVYTLPYQKEQKSAEWSEEDEKNFNTILNLMRDSDLSAQLTNKLSDWFKFIKKRMKEE